MTLLRQLILVIVTLFTLLFVGTFALSVSNTQQYLSEQLRTIAQDTATSLGLTLSPHFAKQDLIVVESMVSAVFDSGYYREVIIRDMEGKPIVERTASVSFEGVPDWFVKMVPLQTPSGESLIMAGWQQAGVISVAANPGQAYTRLWKNVVAAFFWFLACSIFTFGLGVVALQFVLRPLRSVEDQAKAICDREYPVQKKVPWTLELRSVVAAMNRMTMKVKDMFQEQADAMERVRAENFVDPVTGLGNRKYFDMQLRHLMAETEKFETGALVILEIKDLKRINDELGYVKTDAFIAEVGKLITEQCNKLEGVETFATHIAGADFAVVLSDVSEAEAEQFTDQLMQTLPRLHDKGIIDTVDIAHAGIAHYRNQNFGELMSEADTALRAAQSKGVNSWVLNRVAADAGRYSYSATQWGVILNKIIDNRKILLFRQPIVRCTAERPVEHYEILMRVLDEDNSVIPAGIFIPVAKRLGVIQALDKLVVSEVMARLAKGGDGVPVAVNLFPNSILDPAFNDWLVAELGRQPAVARQMILEVSEYGAVEDVSRLKSWVDRIRTTGAKTSIDHFGKGFSSFGYLCDTRIDYLKIDGSFISGIQENRDHRFFVESVIKIAHSLDIKVAAETVENDTEIEALTKLGMDAMMGYGIKPPAKWES
jgi:diguanylate cyclase (GGDEF)-like protein